ncbi:hypothetical protein FGIG_08983 [Fasciola gigantica]|uniref:PDZ domain-containing protein n=1 Tax=Fasciola gigantica TaxID=46835 RepID=A0A504YPC7_FASGI|nr:hypothetical protein FGIG_08983 [Fasciola gigantica]
MALVHSSNPIVRKNRGPLRALHTNLVPDSEIISTPQSVKNDVNRSVCDKNAITHETEAKYTPMQRATNRRTLDRRRSMQNTFPLPLRTSSCRASKSAKMTTNNSTCDIRNHFRVRGLSSLNLSIKSAFDDSNGPSPLTIDPLTDTSYSVTSKQYVSVKRRGSDGLEESSTSAKQMRHSYSAYGSGDIQPVHMTMGAFVKAHPRYYRRRSSADLVEQQHAVPVNRRLSPICPVPMPSGFPNLLPTTYAAVSLPWEAGRSPAAQRTVETQTTPPPMNDPCVAEESNSRSLRQSFGSSQVLCSLRRTFGNLRRAISAERLHRSSRVSSGKSRLDCVTRLSRSPKYSPLSNQKVPQKLVPEKLQFRRAGSKKYENGRRAQRQSTCSAPLIVDLHRTKVSDSNNDNQAHGDGIPYGEDPADCMTCHVLGIYPDGSIRLQLRRPSTKSQFGLFIARDPQGVYVSRLGGVRCTVKLWEVLHVGDRLLEVQGVPCSELEVEDVQNLIRGCELVEFRVQSSSGQR